MTNSQSDINELQTLRREAAELRAKRDRPCSTATGPAAAQDSDRVQEHEIAEPPTMESADAEEAPETDKTLRHLATQIESVVKEMEEAARERPTLALLAAFTVGIIIGQLVTRK